VGLEILFRLTIDDPRKKVALTCLAMQSTKPHSISKQCEIRTF
jgi:hypothetical protein